MDEVNRKRMERMLRSAVMEAILYAVDTAMIRIEDLHTKSLPGYTPDMYKGYGFALDAAKRELQKIKEEISK